MVDFVAHLGVDLGQFGLALEEVQYLQPGEVVARLEMGEDLAEQFGHLTAKASAELARDAGVGGLILTHISRRYRTEQILEEAKAIFPNVYVARDFDRFQIKRGTVEKVNDKS